MIVDGIQHFPRANSLSSVT